MISNLRSKPNNMFNKTVVHSHKAVVTPVTKEIHHKSITPDKVTEMYKEVRKEVEAEFVRGFAISSNHLHGTVVQINRSHEHGRRVIYTRFVLNGEECIDKNEEFDSDGTLLTEADALHKLIKHYKTVVGEELLKDVARTVFKEFPALNHEKHN